MTSTSLEVIHWLCGDEMATERSSHTVTPESQSDKSHQLVQKLRARASLASASYAHHMHSLSLNKSFKGSRLC